MKCKCCKKEKDRAKDYTICWDCLIELDINHKNYKKYDKRTKNKKENIIH